MKFSHALSNSIHITILKHKYYCFHSADEEMGVQKDEVY